MFTIISCFEVALRNKINKHYTSLYGVEWLSDFIYEGGRFDTPSTKRTQNIIRFAKNKLGADYTHFKLIAELDFEPICFKNNTAVIDTNYIRQIYNLILQLFTWMNINAAELLYGLDHIQNVCNEIDKLKN